MPANALVWFKRDLRVVDHAPLAQALHFERFQAVYIFEPEWLGSPECGARHVQFALVSLAELQLRLAERGIALQVHCGPAVQVLQGLQQAHGFSHLLSHEETGSGWSYARDLAVKAWCASAGLNWMELTQTGVVRRLRSRAGWAKHWAQRMSQPMAPSWRGLAALPNSARGMGFGHQALAPGALPSLAELGFSPQGMPDIEAGEKAAWATLRSFLAGRGRHYRRQMSSPVTAEHSCSRLSAHLAFGTISMRSVQQATHKAAAANQDAQLAQSLKSFAGRLRWHCHFMQKLEDEPRIEFENMARSYNGLRPGDGQALGDADKERLAAWCQGRTGFPLVDACMRQLVATGWLNFRMRAMLVSFASYHLWLHWRDTGIFLARQFIDFEPGIHWSQMQMQSGTTGINTLRIYSPRKQALDHDPTGSYVQHWVPERGTPAYPKPIVDEKQALAAAKERLYALRREPLVRLEAAAIVEKHGSRKRSFSAKPKTARVKKAPEPLLTAQQPQPTQPTESPQPTDRQTLLF